MKSLLTTTLFTLALSAPTPLEKRRSGTITLFQNAQYSGASTTLTVDLNADQRCFPIPTGISSLKLSPTNRYLACQLFESPNCDANAGISTWVFNWDVPDLAADDYRIDDKARAIFCSDNGEARG